MVATETQEESKNSVNKSHDHNNTSIAHKNESSPLRLNIVQTPKAKPLKHNLSTVSRQLIVAEML